jgi:hypothetical protein
VGATDSAVVSAHDITPHLMPGRRGYPSATGEHQPLAMALNTNQIKTIEVMLPGKSQAAMPLKGGIQSKRYLGERWWTKVLLISSIALVPLALVAVVKRAR